MSGLPVKDG